VYVPFWIGIWPLNRANASHIGGSSGSKYLSVYLTGLDSSVASADTTTSASSASNTPSSTSTAKPSVVTVGGRYLTVLNAAS
jgi:hypothetical protein